MQISNFTPKSHLCANYSFGISRTWSVPLRRSTLQQFTHPANVLVRCFRWCTAAHSPSRFKATLIHIHSGGAYQFTRLLLPNMLRFCAVGCRHLQREDADRHPYTQPTATEKCELESKREGECTAADSSAKHRPTNRPTATRWCDRERATVVRLEKENNLGRSETGVLSPRLFCQLDNFDCKGGKFTDYSPVSAPNFT